MRAQPKTIQIFLPDGNPRGIRIAEVTSRTVQAIQIPRPLLSEALKRRELQWVGVYCLFGSDEESSEITAYIGESENCFERFKQHHFTKDFWVTAVAAVSKDNSFTKIHGEYLEWLAVNKAAEIGRYHLDNGKPVYKPNISEALEADLQDYFDTIRILFSTLGFPIFEPLKDKGGRGQGKLICQGKNAKAEGEYTEEGLLVLAGSSANIGETKTDDSWVTGLRRRLEEQRIIAREKDVYRFTKDHLFNSPSAAAVAILGRRANGWTEWKYRDGRTLDQVHRQKDN